MARILDRRRLARLLGAEGKTAPPAARIIGRVTLWRPFAEARRLTAAEEELPGFLALVISGLKASLSVRLALKEAAELVRGPLADELARTMAEVEAGVPMDLALSDLAGRLPLPELGFLAALLTAHVRTGGDLTAALASLAEVTRERVALRREVRTMTAQSRSSALVMSLMPPIFLIFAPVLTGYSLFDMLTRPAGWGLLVTGVALDVAGFLAMRRLVEGVRA